VRNARESARVHRSLWSWMAEKRERSCTSVRRRTARRTGSSLITKSRHRSESSAENLRSQFVFRRNRARGFCRLFSRSFPGELARANFEMVALDYFRRLGHDNHHRLFQVYGWEEKKTKTSWGGTSVDHEKLAEAQIRAMTTADLNRFCELRACPRFVLPCLQFRGGSVERSQPRANGWPLQDRRVQSHHNNHKRFFEKAEKQSKERKRPGGKERRSERAVRT
jgi:hypothetical protein